MIRYDTILESKAGRRQLGTKNQKRLKERNQKHKLDMPRRDCKRQNPWCQSCERERFVVGRIYKKGMRVLDL